MCRNKRHETKWTTLEQKAEQKKFYIENNIILQNIFQLSTKNRESSQKENQPIAYIVHRTYTHTHTRIENFNEEWMNKEQMRRNIGKHVSETLRCEK